MRKLADSLEGGDSSSTTSSNSISINDLTIELIVSKEKTLLKKRDDELKAAKKEIKSNA